MAYKYEPMKKFDISNFINFDQSYNSIHKEYYKTSHPGPTIYSEIFISCGLYTTYKRGL